MSEKTTRLVDLTKIYSDETNEHEKLSQEYNK